jgi:UDP-N-acetyl-D-mannosaminuronate dehydrogenase
MKSIVIGLGETGRPLAKVLSVNGRVFGIDLIDDFMIGDNSIEWDEPDFINICLPYSKKFIEIVQEYRKMHIVNKKNTITIIHSTVPIGTTSMIPDAVHSPILGKHDNMEKSLTTFTKWIGGERAFEARDYLEGAGISCRCVATPEETEALKLMCLATYGVSIALAQYRNSIAKKYGFNYQDILDWDINYNAEVESRLQRPIITNPNGVIGGHCVTQGTRLLNQSDSNPLLDEVVKYAHS